MGHWVPKVCDVHECEWHVTNKIPNMWRWMRLGPGQGELGAVGDWSALVRLNTFSCFPPVPKRCRWVQHVDSFIDLK